MKESITPPTGHKTGERAGKPQLGGTAVDVRRRRPDSRTASGAGNPAGFSKLGSRHATRCIASQCSTMRIRSPCKLHCAIETHLIWPSSHVSIPQKLRVTCSRPAELCCSRRRPLRLEYAVVSRTHAKDWRWSSPKCRRSHFVST